MFLVKSIPLALALLPSLTVSVFIWSSRPFICSCPTLSHMFSAHTPVLHTWCFSRHTSIFLNGPCSNLQCIFTRYYIYSCIKPWKICLFSSFNFVPLFHTFHFTRQNPTKNTLIFALHSDIKPTGGAVLSRDKMRTLIFATCISQVLEVLDRI